MIPYMSSPTIFPSNFDLHSISDGLVSTQCTTVGSHLPNDFVSLDCLDENYIITLYMDEKGIWGLRLRSQSELTLVSLLHHLLSL
jgi:hypothetical protein